MASVTAFFAGLVAFSKTFNTLSVYIDMFIAEWVKHDIDKIGGAAAAKKEEFEVFNAALKKTTSDSERRVLLRTLHGLRDSLPEQPRP